MAEQKTIKPRSQKFEVLGELADLNAFIKATNSHYTVGNRVKRENTETVSHEALVNKVEPVRDYPVRVVFSWYSKDNRRDIDNVAFAKKFVLDGLVEAGVLENDSRKFVCGFADEFHIDRKRPRVEVEIIENI